MKRPAFFVSRLYGAIAGHDGLEGTMKDRTDNHPASTDSQGPKETMTGKERGYPMHTVSVPILSPSIVLRHCYPFRQNWIQKQSFPQFIVKY